MGADGRVSLCSEIQSNDGKLMGRANKTSLLFCRLLPRRRCICLLISPLFLPGVQRRQRQVSFYESGKHQGSCCQAIITTRLPPPSSATAKKSSPPPVAVVATVSFLSCLTFASASAVIPPSLYLSSAPPSRSLSIAVSTFYKTTIPLSCIFRATAVIPYLSSFLTAHPIPFLPPSPPSGLPLHSFCPLSPLFFISGLLLSYLPSSPFSCRFHWDRRSLSCPEKNLPAHLGLRGASPVSSAFPPSHTPMHGCITPFPRPRHCMR